MPLMLALMAVSAFAQNQMPPIPIDKDVRIGKLDNGLTYYIRYNNWPENRAEFYIAQRVGSIQEDENQRGLAHFLEHMCFNGTQNYPGDSILRYCESIGVKFGTDINAYTSTDRTVYNISNVPTGNVNALDSCLLILHDWADGLLLEPKEIDKERGVIHEEWRLRTSPVMRMLYRCLPTLYPGSKYGERLPIGLLSVIDNFEYQALRDYYEKWYRPDNQAIIVVGDVDVDRTEAQIKKMFSGIVMPKNPAPVVREAVPDNNEMIVVVEKDKELSSNSIELYFKRDGVEPEQKANMDYFVVDMVNSACRSMLNERLQDYVKQPDCPFVDVYVGNDNFLVSDTKDALSLSVSPKDGMSEQSVAAAYREALRASRFGFTATEYNRYKQRLNSSLDKQYSNKDKRTNASFCMAYADHFCDNEPIPSIDDYYQVMKQIIPAIPLDVVNMCMAKMVSNTDTNVVVLSLNIEKEGAVYPKEENLKKAVQQVRTEQLTAYVDNVKNEPLIQKLPKAGKIKSTKKNEVLGYTELTLSNGAKVLLMKTDHKKDQVLFEAVGQGGSSLYGAEDYINLQMFSSVIDQSGLGNFSQSELLKALAGKIVSVSPSLDTRRVRLSGSSTPNDVETLLQLIYLHFTKINKDQEAFDNLMKQEEISLKNKALSPDQAYSDSLTVTMRCHNPRFQPMELADLAKVNYDRILQIAKEQFANAAGFTFSFVGNFDEQAILPLIERYLASLPAQKKVVKGHDVEPLPKGVVLNHFTRKMETPKAIGAVAWLSEDIPATLENRIRASMLGQVASMIYIKQIREEASAAYYAGANANVSREDEKNIAQLFAYCPMKPEKGEIAMSIMREELQKMATTVDADMLTKVKEYMLKNHADKLKDNSYWQSRIWSMYEYGLDYHTNYDAIVQAQTPATIAAFVTELLKSGTRVEVVMMPQE